MREAVIVATARTPIGKAYRGAFNNTQAQSLCGHVIAAAVQRAGIDPAEIADVVVGAALQQGTTGSNVGRQCALRAGLPTSVAGMSIDRQCASGLMAVAIAMRPEAHCRSIDMPATLVGRPARRAHWRATLPPLEPCWSAAPMTTSSTSAPSTLARSSAL